MTTKVDVNLINPFIKATIDSLQTMAYVQPERKGIKLKEDNVMNGDLSAVMPLSGDFVGTVVVSFSEKLSCRLFSNMLNMSSDGDLLATSLNDEVEDSVMEIINLISGGAKTIFSAEEVKFTIGLPTLISGTNHKITRDTNIPCILCEFDVSGESFFLEVSINKQ